MIDSLIINVSRKELIQILGAYFIKQGLFTLDRYNMLSIVGVQPEIICTAYRENGEVKVTPPSETFSEVEKKDEEKETGRRIDLSDETEKKLDG